MQKAVLMGNNGVLPVYTEGTSVPGEEMLESDVSFCWCMHSSS